MSTEADSHIVLVTGLADGYDDRLIAHAVAEFTGNPVIVMSVHPNELKLRLPNNCATHVVKMLIEMHLNTDDSVAQQRVDVARM